MSQKRFKGLTPSSQRVIPALVTLFLVIALFLCTPLFLHPQMAHASGRDPLQWPFASTSIWNMPIGSNAQYVPANIPQASYTSPDPNWFIITHSSDPVRNVYVPGNWGPGRCTGTTYVTSTPFPDSVIVPDATDGSTPNNASAILQPDGHTIVQLEPLARCTAGGNVYGYQACTSDLYGDGICGAHFGSGLSSIGGEIRLSELQASGDNTIPHALQLEIWDNYLGQCGLTLHGQVENGYRWPADRADGGACDPNNSSRYKGTNPSLVQGSLLAIPPSATPASLGITTDVGRKMFYALQNYGGYVVDDTGWDDNQIGVENTVPDYYDFWNTYHNDINILFSNLQVVDNNGPNNIGGGGTLRAPMAPPLNNSTPTPTPTNTPTPTPTPGGGSLSGSVASASSSTTYNLTNQGTTDWVHWGNGSYPGQDRKSGGSAISGVSTFGSGLNTGTWHDSSRNFSWSNGTPTASASDSQTYIWDNGSNGSGFSFTVPADTTTRTLTVYAGGANGGVSGTLQASLSDNSASAYSSSFGPTGSSLLTNIYTITYHAASAGQTLTVKLTKTGGSSGGSAPSVDLIAAALSTSGGGGSGSLSGSVASASSSTTYNLTSLGTTDWVHWGNGSYPGQDRKSGGNAISGVSTFGSGLNTGTWYDSSRNFSWSNGTPTASASDSQTYIWDNGNSGTGFSFTVPADTTTRTLTVYVGAPGGGASGTFNASLSDNSATAYTNSFGPTGSNMVTYVYTITYHAASAGQTLTITLTKTSSSSGGSAPSIDLIAATLS